ncbi:SMI1/KNR4 family protein [Niabella hibiscisoli]|uniref:SMI1/KNR4 family protein n=1 Tax=Niabella hibiscisoli TaxID=1825928 RepID=UPI001F100CF5|nr:SMI1/KNR4 family protein [Niabella hibiscisoli]MCH5716890.1 SMI1/KNR4 family protein [Niabella hibiscisoli]
MLEINKKEDIIIPFNKIGEVDWETKTRLIIESIAENWNDDLKEPLGIDAISELESRLGTSLPEGLRLFYQTVGLADIGEQLQSFDEIGWLKNIWAEQPQYGPDFTEEDLVHLPYLVSFSNYLGNGNMFCFHSETKEIYYYDHDSKPYLTKMFEHVDDYLKGCLIFAQSDLFGEAEQDEVERWAEEIVSDLVGEDTVRKWRY